MKTDKFYEDEATAFVDKHPEYVASQANCDALFLRLKRKRLGMNRDTLGIVFEELKAEGQLQIAPAREADSGDEEEMDREGCEKNETQGNDRELRESDEEEDRSGQKEGREDSSQGDLRAERSKGSKTTQ
jgi:hypothetical protein